MYAGKDYDLAGFAVGAVERSAILPKPDISDGDVILGLASSGLHSNGYSLVRKIVEVGGLEWDAKAPFSPDVSLGKALLVPTRIYVKPLLAAIRANSGVKGLAHITGGGFTENIPRVLPTGVGAAIDLSALAPPPVFGWLAKEGGVAESEMLRTFNCGIGMVVISSAEDAEKVTETLRVSGESVIPLGTIVSDTSQSVTYTGAIKW